METRTGKNIIGYQETRIPCPHCGVEVRLPLPKDYELEMLKKKYSELFVEHQNLLSRMKEGDTP